MLCHVVTSHVTLAGLGTARAMSRSMSKFKRAIARWIGIVLAGRWHWRPRVWVHLPFVAPVRTEPQCRVESGFVVVRYFSEGWAGGWCRGEAWADLARRFAIVPDARWGDDPAAMWNPWRKAHEHGFHWEWRCPLARVRNT